MQSGKRVNLDGQGRSLPVRVTFYQLTGIEGLEEDLDFDRFQAAPEERLGDLLIDQHARFIDPDNVEKILIEPDVTATHILAVAGFRKDDAWYKIYPIPLDHAEAICEHKAEARKKEFPKPLGSPCFYIFLEDYRIEGGVRWAPRFDRDRFEELQCAPPPKRKKKAKSNKKRKKLKVPKIPETPRTPQVPETPKAPSAPKAPTKPRVNKPL